MDFATQKDDVRAIDSTVKNKWRWDWLDSDIMQQYIRKLKFSGQAHCILCNKTLIYQCGGKKDHLWLINLTFFMTIKYCLNT